MKEIKSKKRAAKKNSVPWFKTMGRQVGLSERIIAAIVREQQARIRKLNRRSAQILSDAIKEADPGWGEKYNIYGKLACMLDRCQYIPCGSAACAQCTAAKQLHYQGVSVGSSVPGHTTLHLAYLTPTNEYYFSGWTATDLVTRHEDGC
ncbi:hypothetical protein ADN76_000295 [Salmonella enterica subsp. enterica serovar Java]|nr:hypothetical protein [Salmonella enterica subsp. enterica serovar Java]EEL6231177.1 hypothetical protein [Salmonella enterica]EIN0239604.1 hypothetical protein [Salmonella enterica]